MVPSERLETNYLVTVNFPQRVLEDRLWELCMSWSESMCGQGRLSNYKLKVPIYGSCLRSGLRGAKRGKKKGKTMVVYFRKKLASFKAFQTKKNQSRTERPKTQHGLLQARFVPVYPTRFCPPSSSWQCRYWQRENNNKRVFREIFTVISTIWSGEQRTQCTRHRQPY